MHRAVQASRCSVCSRTGCAITVCPCLVAGCWARRDPIVPPIRVGAPLCTAAQLAGHNRVGRGRRIFTRWPPLLVPNFRFMLHKSRQLAHHLRSAKARSRRIWRWALLQSPPQSQGGLVDHSGLGTSTDHRMARRRGDISMNLLSSMMHAHFMLVSELAITAATVPSQQRHLSDMN